jgi:hypothetical protein
LCDTKGCAGHTGICFYSADMTSLPSVISMIERSAVVKQVKTGEWYQVMAHNTLTANYHGCQITPLTPLEGNMALSDRVSMMQYTCPK